MIYRNITGSLLEALSDSPVVLLNGARQTGKSTLAKWLSEEHHPARYITLDDISILSAMKNDPEGFISGIKENCIIDEIQRAPEAFIAIKSAVDRNRKPGRFLLTGSANILLLPKLSESLAGRMEIHTLWPLSQGEIEGAHDNFLDMVFSKDFPLSLKSSEIRASLAKRISEGGYPESLTKKNPARRKAWLDSYLTTILQRDVRDLANIEGLTALPKLLHLLAARTASLFNFAELSRSSSLPQSTLKRYITLLEAIFIIVFLPAWSGNLGKRMVKAPKVFLNDTGLAMNLLGIEENAILSESYNFGPLLENFVVLELLKQTTWNKTLPKLFHYRTQTGIEVDIAAENAAGKIVGIEVKAGRSLSARDYQPLRLMSESLGKRFHRGILLYTGEESFPFGQNLFAMPVDAIWKTGKMRQE